MRFRIDASRNDANWRRFTGVDFGGPDESIQLFSRNPKKFQEKFASPPGPITGLKEDVRIAKQVFGILKQGIYISSSQ